MSIAIAGRSNQSNILTAILVILEQFKGRLKNPNFCGIISSRVAISLRLQMLVYILNYQALLLFLQKNKWTNAKFLSNMTVDSDHAYIFVDLAYFFP